MRILLHSSLISWAAVLSTSLRPSMKTTIRWDAGMTRLSFWSKWYRLVASPSVHAKSSRIPARQQSSGQLNGREEQARNTLSK